MNIKKYCLECNELIKGRTDKKFCSPYCKSSYHYKKNKESENSTFVNIDQTLRRNRQILKSYNKAGKSTVRKETLIKAGFNPNYFTHYWKGKKNNLYLFCYEFGFREIKDNSFQKYILIKWQSFMEK